MPTISFTPADLYHLIGQRLTEAKLKFLVESVKGELESVLSREITVKLNDTNLPYLWSVEGLARAFRGLLGKKKGIPKVKYVRTKDKVIVDRKLAKIRPYIACFVAKGKKIDDYLLKQIIQLQEKLAENFGRKREKISIGVYPFRKISFPIYYKACKPTSVRFVPLDFQNPLSLKEILAQHPKGKEYGHIISGFKDYPVLMDAKKEVLSLAPVINSSTTGKLEIGDSEIFFDATGTDYDSVQLVANIFAYALADRGFKIYSLVVDYRGKKVQTPSFETRAVKVPFDEIEHMLGIKLSEAKIKLLLGKAGFDYSKKKVVIPSYRQDIMHPVDIVEEIAIAYGYDKLPSIPLETYTVGNTFPIQRFLDNARDLMVGLGYQEALTPLLSNKILLYDKLGVNDFGTIEIKNFMSANYSCVRTWIIPLLIEILSKNKHYDFPQRIFEAGLVTRRTNELVQDEYHLAAASSHATANFTEVRQAVEFLLRMLGLRYEVEEFELGCFVPGRAAEIRIKKQPVAFLGEIHPEVLRGFGLTMPVVAFEINLSALFLQV